MKVDKIIIKTIKFLVVTNSFMIGTYVFAGEIFNPALLSSDDDSVADLSRFNNNEGQAPGVYPVEVFLNNQLIGTRDFIFNIKKEDVNNPSKDDSGLSACLTVKYLEKLHIDITSFKDMYSEDGCVDLSKEIPNAFSLYDFEKSKLYISIPEIALKNDVRGYIPPEYWDNGITAALFNYNFSAFNSESEGITSSSYFLNLNSSFNLGPWRLNNTSTWSHYKNGASSSDQWKNISTYAERNIIGAKAILTLGDTYTSNSIFDSSGIRGVRLYSDDTMLPESQVGFAPTIRGIANSNAVVIVKQNGYTLYRKNVAPGAFEINDLYQTSNSGDLQVTVQESDGTENSFIVPYSTVPVLQREGRLSFSLSAGEYRSSYSDRDTPIFLDGTLFLGLPKSMTAYGGIQLSKNYKAIAAGIGMNLGHYGALSVDVTQAYSTLIDNIKKQGTSIRFLYAKSLNSFGTNFQLLGYRYSSKGFYTLDDTTYKNALGYNIDTSKNNSEQLTDLFLSQNYYNLNDVKKGRAQVNISQNIKNIGSFYISGMQQTYWNSRKSDEYWQAGYNFNIKDTTFNIAYNYNKNETYSDKQISLNVTLPLDKWLFGKRTPANINRNSLYANSGTSSDLHGNTRQQISLSGSLLKDNNLNFSIQRGYSNQYGDSGNVNLNYKGAYSNSNIGLAYSDGYKQVSYGLSGGIVLHSDGVTFSQPLNKTNILIKAPKAADVKVENATGVYTDWRGYAVIPFATPYRNNRISLDANTFSEDTEIEDNITNVVPTRGALIRAEFDTKKGEKALITLKQANGKSVPFGAMVTNDVGSTGMVADDGLVYLSGLPKTSTLKVKWGNYKNQSCLAEYVGKEIIDSKQASVSYQTLTCL